MSDRAVVSPQLEGSAGARDYSSSVFTAWLSATRKAARDVVVKSGKVPDSPDPDQDSDQCTVAETGYASSGSPADEAR